MSTSDLYFVNKKSTRHIAEFRDGHGTAPVLWSVLCVEYLGWDEYDWSFGHEGKMRSLWELAFDPRVPFHLRLCHAFTFDRAVCPKDKLLELASACVETSDKIPPGKINHWKAIADMLLKLRTPGQSIGVALSPTSVSDCWLDWKGQTKIWLITDEVKPSIREISL